MRVISLAAVGGLILNFAIVTSLAASPEYQQWLKEAYPADGPGAAVIVVKDRQVLFRGASGMADMELGVALSADNVFRIGSITKQFTAAGILLLQEQGKLSVTDDVKTYLPDYPTHGHTIRIEHLLSHTSGIFNYTDIPSYFNGAEIRKDVSTEQLIELFANLPMDFPPGEQFHYSNSGYALLGAIIEQVSGLPYAEFMQANIFDKLGLEHTYHGGLQIIPNRASGYEGAAAGQYRNAAYLSMTHPHGAGALLSTVDDLAKWTAALFDGELLSKASVRKMTTDFRLNNGEHTGYGHGFAVGERFGEKEISHNGGIHGFTSSGVWLPRKKVYAVVLSNSADSRAADFLAARMAFDAAGADYPRFTPIALDPELMAQYLGVYQIDELQTRSVLVDGGQLYTQRTGGGRSAIVAHGKDAFFYPGSFTHLKFNRDRSGRVVAMSMYHGGAAEAERAEWISELSVHTRKVADVSPEIYDLWAGRYRLAAGAVLDVRRDGQHLFVHLTGQPEYEVFPSSPTRYFLKAVDAEIEFSAGDDGRASSVVIMQSGAEETANRVE